MKIWDVESSKQFGVLRHTLSVRHVSWSPDSRRLVSSDITGNTNVRDVAAQNLVANYNGTISAFSPDGTVLAVGGPGSVYNGDEAQAGTVTLHYAPPLGEIAPLQ